jgi:hypothetical protein
MTGSESERDEDRDLRHMLQSRVSSTSAPHDAAVLKAARDFARADVPVRLEGSASPPNLSSGRPWSGVSRVWYAAAGVMAVIVTGAVWREHTLRREVQALAAERVGLTRATADRRGGNRQPPAFVLLSTVLSPGGLRGADSLAEVLIPSGAGAVRLRLESDPAADRRADEIVLATRAGIPVWQGRPLAIQTGGAQEILIAEIPATLLAPGEYELSLRRANGQPDYYYFKVTRE